VDGVVAVNHVGVSVADLGRAEQFWALLGFDRVTGWTWGPGTTPADEALALTGSGAEVAILQGPTSFLELFAFSSPVPAARAVDAPGIAGLAVAVADAASTQDRLAKAGFSASSGRTTCPDGTPVELLEGDPPGLRRVVLRVPDPGRHPFATVTALTPVALDAVPGGDGPVARPCDLGANHVCLDVVGLAHVRTALGDTVRWHHPVTASSGGIASVCYGTTHDGVVVELLESHSPQATLSRTRLTAATAR
jgi:catechol 2,3-dioxygenase-like lactoylglutathione lyase family enzyme